MPTYHYNFVRADGVILHASEEAENELILARRLQQNSCFLLHASTQLSWHARAMNLQFGVNRLSFILIIHELGSLLKAGLPVDRSLTILVGLITDLRLRAALSHIRDNIRRGTSLADAMEIESEIFSAFHINLVRAGEMSGNLDAALLRLADYLRQQDTLKSQIQIALIYPAILVFVGIASLVLLATIVLPELAPMFSDAGTQLPLPTRVILSGSEFVRRFGWLLTIVIVGSTVASRRILRKPDIQKNWDRLKLKIPLLGPIILSTQTARFSRTTGTLLSAGVALPLALLLARQTLTNKAFREAVRQVTNNVRGGVSLADALQKENIFPKIAAQLISVGEETGHVDQMLLHQAELFERSSARQVANLVAILVPLLTITIGTAVAGVLASILLAVIKLNELAS